MNKERDDMEDNRVPGWSRITIVELPQPGLVVEDEGICLQVTTRTPHSEELHREK